MVRRMMVFASAVLASASFAGGPFHDEASGPRALPGDLVPPFGMVDASGHLPPPPALPPGVTLPGAWGPPESTAPGPTGAEALRMVRAAVRVCGAAGYRVGAAVVDSSGEARAMLSADGADGSHGFVGMRKAEAALVFATPSSAVGALVVRDPAALARLTPAMFVTGGALPIRRGGRVIGAIGVSGAAGKVIGRQDEICAAAGLAAMRGT